MKSFLKLTLIYTFIFELIFQFLIFFNFKYVKIPDLFYNGYCNQKYWNFNDKIIKFDSETEYHPILSYVKKGLEIPNSLEDQASFENSYFDENLISLYGSSYINHKEFKSLISNNSNFEFKNYNNGVKNTLTSAIKLANNNIAISGLGGVITIVDFNNDKSISTCIRQDRLGNNAIVEAKNNNLLIIGQKGARLHNMDECYASSMQSTSANAWVQTKTN